MRTIRLGTFETNSSSCHCLVVMDDKTFNEFKLGQIIIENGDSEFYTIEDWAKKLYDCVENANLDTIDWYESYYGKDGEDVLDENGVIDKKYAKENKLKYRTFDEYMNHSRKIGEYYDNLPLERYIEILGMCYEQHAYCDDHMSSWSWDGVKGITDEERNVLYASSYLYEDGFIIGMKGLRNIPKDGPYEIKKINNHAIEIFYATFG